MIRQAISELINGDSLTMEQASLVMAEIMDGQVTPAQFGAFVTAIRLRGETIEEIVGMVKTMRLRYLPVNFDEPVVDNCGTGGDDTATFNISTTAAFVVAGTGIKVAKHGNRAMSSRCGSADVLEALGVKIDLNSEQVKQCLQQVGICFMFAQLFHPAMKHAAAPRREIGIRTVFNILGPLANPAGTKHQVIGVTNRELGQKMAGALQLLGTKHALVVHAENGMDEISISGLSNIWEVYNNKQVIDSYVVSPADFGFKPALDATIKGGDAAENAMILRSVLAGEKSPRRDAVIMNAAAAISAFSQFTVGRQGLVSNARLAEEAIDSGRALEKLNLLIEFTQKYSPAIIA